MSQTNFICPSICIDFFVCPNGTKFACCKDGIYALTSTGKSFPEALILGSTNPQYDKRLFIDLLTNSEHVNFKLRTWGEHEENCIVYQEAF
jgi:hypothetical protein